MCNTPYESSDRTVDQLENRLNQDANNRARNIRYKFFSNLSSSVQQSLKTTPVTVPSGQSPHSAFLIAETSQLDENSMLSVRIVPSGMIVLLNMEPTK